MSNGMPSAGMSRRAREDLEEARRDGLVPDLSDLIPRPRISPGDCRRGYVLDIELGLVNDNARYKTFGHVVLTWFVDYED
jgi:hypothetical protein